MGAHTRQGRDPETGMRQRSFVHVKGLRRDAEAELARLIAAADRGIDVEPSKLTVKEYMGRWLTDYAKPNLAPSSYERYAECVRLHIVPALGQLRLGDLRPAHIVAAQRRWLESGGRGGRSLAPRTVLKLHRILREALQHAVRWQLVPVNAADAVQPPRAQRSEIAALTPDQARTLIDAARGDDMETPIITALYTGLRVGELLGLRWQDVTVETGMVRVVQSIRPARGGTFTIGPTKTHRSQRAVSIPRIVVTALTDHHRQQSAWRLALAGSWPDHDLVFTDPLGRPLTAMRLRWALWRLLRTAGLPKIRLHDLRHTMATLMLAAGEHPKVVSERLGHSTVALTLDVYSHVVPGLQEAAAERLADLLRTPGGRSEQGSDRAVVGRMSAIGPIDASESGS